MTDAAAALEPGRQIEILDELTEEQAASVLALIHEAARTDGTTAVSEQGRLQLRGGPREGIRHFLLTADGRLAGYGQLEDTDPVEAPAAELVVHPALRGRGHGRALGSALLHASGKRIRVWAHGGKSAARHLAQVLGLTLFRELRQLRRPLGPDAAPLPDPVLPPGVTVRTFVPGQDDAAWLAANAAAFAHHPEQGALTQRDLNDRIAQPWFDAKGFFLAERRASWSASTGRRSTRRSGSARSTWSASARAPRAAASARPSPRSASTTWPSPACRRRCSTWTPTTRRP